MPLNSLTARQAQVLPPDIRGPLVEHPQRFSLLEVCSWWRSLLCNGGHSVFRSTGQSYSVIVRTLQVVLDLGRRPEARFLGVMGGEYLRDEEVCVAVTLLASISRICKPIVCCPV